MMQTILNFVTRKWNIANDNLKSNLYDYNDTYILVRGDITIIGHQATQVAFKKLCTIY